MRADFFLPSVAQPATAFRLSSGPTPSPATKKSAALPIEADILARITKERPLLLSVSLPLLDL